MIEDEKREREKEKGRFDGAHRECACILILEPSLPQINVFASNTFLLRFILQPCRGVSLSFSFSLSLSLSLSLFVLISLASRSLPFLFSRAPPHDNNYPFDSCARRSQSHDPSSCHFPLCTLRPSIERYLQSIIPLLRPTRLINNLPWCIISAGLSINS